MTSPARPVTEIQIAGVPYRVQSSADERDLHRLAALVEARLAQLPANQRHDSRSLVLVALALAHDLHLEQQAHHALRGQVASHLTSLITRIDTALDHRDDQGDPLPAVPEVCGSSNVSPERPDAPPTAAPAAAPSPGRAVTRRRQPDVTTATNDSSRPPRVR